MRVSKRTTGFTLLELILVMAVFSVVTTIGVTAFMKMMTVWGETTAGMDTNTKCVRIFDTIRGDIQRVASAQRTGQALVGTDRLEQEDQINRRLPQDDRIIIPIFQKGRAEREWQRLSVRYAIDRESSPPALVRTLGAWDNPDPSEARLVVAEDVVAMNITYLDTDNTWVDGWSKQHLPRAVKVSLTIGMENRPFDHISRECVFPIHIK